MNSLRCKTSMILLVHFSVSWCNVLCIIYHSSKDTSLNRTLFLYQMCLSALREYSVVSFPASFQEAARRCKMEFLSSPDDKKLRWILSDQCPIPKLITEKEELDQEEADHLDEGTPVQEDKDLKTEPTSLDEVSSISDESVSHSSSVEKIFKQEFKAKAKARGGRGKKGRGKGFIRLTSLEQEMIEWSCGGFLPAGRDGLRPIVDQQVQVRVIPLGGGANEEKGLRTGGCGPDEDLSRRKQKVMLLHVRSKGEDYVAPKTLNNNLLKSP